MSCLVGFHFKIKNLKNLHSIVSPIIAISIKMHQKNILKENYGIFIPKKIKNNESV